MVEGICRTCLGCNRLEDFTFRGTKECRNYIRGVQINEFKQKCKGRID